MINSVYGLLVPVYGAIAPIFAINGAPIILFLGLASFFVPAGYLAKVAGLSYGKISNILFLLFVALMASYLFYPNFLEHVGPGITLRGIAFLRGADLYPDPADPSFRGMMYGPLLSEIQAFAIAFVPSVIFSSKLTGIISFLLACFFLFRLARKEGNSLARPYFILFLLPFGAYAFWNRAEPFLLLLVTLCLWAVYVLPGWAAILIIGVSAGFASALKLHGFLYFLPLCFLLPHRKGHALLAALVMAILATGSFLFCFLPGNVSLLSFLALIPLNAKHGFLGRILIYNAIFLVALWLPLVCYLIRTREYSDVISRPLIMLLVAECIVALIGSKSGAGFHHLLPFIPISSIVFSRIITSDRSYSPDAARLAYLPVYVGLLAPALLSMAFYSGVMVKNWVPYRQARQEVALFDSRYKNVVMGVATDVMTYPFTFFHVDLEKNGTQQIDYQSFMDAQFSGVKDDRLIQLLEQGKIKYVMIPRDGAPFGLLNYYSQKPLFSDGIRLAFKDHFSRVAEGTYFDVYAFAESLRAPGGHDRSR